MSDFCFIWGFIAYIVFSYVLADPTHEEEDLADSYVSVICSANNPGKLWGIFKQGGTCISPDKLKECISRTIDHTQALVSQIEGALEAN